MDPIIGGALISAGSSLLGGLFGSKGDKGAARRQEALQREFAQHGVRWRVEDAKAAGLHPLYALGAQLPSYSPVYEQQDPGMGPYLAEAGQNIGRAVAASQTAQERQMNALILARTAGELEESDLRRQLLQLEIDRARGASGGSFQTFPVVNEQEALSALGGMTQITPTETVSRSLSDSSVMAGMTPMWREFELSPGFKMRLPGGVKGDPAEALESISESLPLLLATLEENDRAYGPEWTDKMVERYLGKEGAQVRKIIQWLRSPDRVGTPLPSRLQETWDEMKKARREGRRYPPPR